MASKSDAPRPEPARDAPPREAPPYEFSEPHKESFLALGASMSFVGVCTMLLAVLSAVFALGEVYLGFWPNGIATVAAAALYGVQAWWMVSGGRSLGAMVRTKGRDIEYLMEAVVQLRRLFGLARIVIIVLAMVVVLAGALVVYCNFVVEKGGRCFGALG